MITDQFGLVLGRLDTLLKEKCAGVESIRYVNRMDMYGDRDANFDLTFLWKLSTECPPYFELGADADGSYDSKITGLAVCVQSGPQYSGTQWMLQATQGHWILTGDLEQLHTISCYVLDSDSDPSRLGFRNRLCEERLYQVLNAYRGLLHPHFNL